MSTPAVQVESIGKQYQLGLRERSRRTFREAAMELAAAPLRRLRQLSGETQEGRFWALRDVSFDVPEGEVLGIIGHNGAGKSTLLKILSRITEPTEGRAIVRGRVASLLEVGTGFHQELSGRENVFLNGAILGMSREEIRRKFDEIVDFAGVETFLDTPIKRYSSGMKVRLAFAVAAHLDPEILIIDEVLAVGDAEFQSKCLGKMNDVARSGRTVLFVSHNMPAVERLCQRCVILNHGKVSSIGTAQQEIHRYLTTYFVQNLDWHAEKRPLGIPHYTRVRVCDADRTPVTAVTSSMQIGFELDCVIPVPKPSLKLGVCILNAEGQAIFSTSPVDDGVPFPTEAGHYTYWLKLPGTILMPQRYSVTVSLYEFGRCYANIDGCIVLDVAPADSLANQVDRNRPGHLQLQCTWERYRYDAEALAC